MIHVVIYSLATGAVRSVQDPQENVPNAIAYMNQVVIAPGEGRLIYNVGSGTDNLYAWQLAVSKHTGLIPSSLHPDVAAFVIANAGIALTTVHDRYVVIDGNNNIVSFIQADPACGDGYPGMTLIQHDTADMRWTFTPPNTFTAPVVVTKP